MSFSCPVELNWATSAEIKLKPHKPIKTPNPRKLDSLAVLCIPRDSTIDDWRLKSLMVVQLRRMRKECLATTWLEGMAEYGTGYTDGEAITDLVVSVGEYRESLKQREERLCDSAQRELALLRKLIERSTSH